MLHHIYGLLAHIPSRRHGVWTVGYAYVVLTIYLTCFVVPLHSTFTFRLLTFLHASLSRMVRGVTQVDSSVFLIQAPEDCRGLPRVFSIRGSNLLSVV